METWRALFRGRLVPLLSDEALEALRSVLFAEDCWALTEAAFGGEVLRMRQKRETKVERGLFEDFKTVVRAADLPPGESVMFPLYDAGLTLGDVMAFWAGQSFDLRLNQDEGNCDLCFLKGGAKLIGLMKQRPSLATWWIEREARAAQGRARNATVEQFRNDRPCYAELLDIATDRLQGPGWLFADKGNVGGCGETDECRCTD